MSKSLDIYFKVLIKKLYTIDENTTNILVNKALDDSELYYI